MGILSVRAGSIQLRVTERLVPYFIFKRLIYFKKESIIFWNAISSLTIGTI
jgi:hypothetical protein